MPISLPLTSAPGSIGAGTRVLGTVALDDNANAFIKDVLIPSTRELTLARMEGRYGRQSREKEDYGPLKITVHGYWGDGGGRYWRDFKAALLNQQHVTFTLGDGTRFEWVDVLDVQATPIASSGAGTAQPDQRWAYVMTLASYEPFARDVAPGLVNLGALTTSAGTSQTTVTTNYPGTVFAEPTWQFTFTIQGGATVSSVRLQNTTTGESCTYTGSIPAGTWYLLMDASGGAGGANRTTPNNDQYGLLQVSSLGRGMTLQQLSGSAADVDFTGTIPTLGANATVAVPPTAQANTIIATVTASAVLTGANLSFAAPSRWHR